MPQTQVVFFQDDDRSVPALDWLREIKLRDPRITAKFHELRVRFGTVNYRLLYGFHEQGGRQTVAILVHGLTKERAVPPSDIDLAVRRLAAFAADPEAHNYVRPIPLAPRKRTHE